MTKTLVSKLRFIEVVVWSLASSLLCCFPVNSYWEIRHRRMNSCDSGGGHKLKDSKGIGGLGKH